MRLLVIGGTRFVGRAVVSQALQRGDDVAIFHRGKTNPDLFPEAEHLIGDRDSESDLSVLRGREFDAVVDPSAYFPRQVRSLVRALDGRINHYSFVSSISVYASHSTVGATEAAPRMVLDDPKTEDLEGAYGGLKALCEDELERALPGRVHSLRAGVIVGPHDYMGRFDYWIHRLRAGGDVLVPEPRAQPMQLIDVADLAAWTLYGIDNKVVGPMNATGTPGDIDFGEMIAAIARVTESRATLTWVAESFLASHGVAPWSELPLWLALDHNPSHAGFLTYDNRLARDHGLVLRPLDDTIESIIASHRKSEADRRFDYGNAPGSVGLAPERERQLLDEWRAT